MRNFTQRTSVRILTQVVLTSLFVIQNHCGLLAASSLIRNAAFTSSTSLSDKSPLPCHQANTPAKKSSECNQDCCTRIQAVLQVQDIKISVEDLFRSVSPLADLSLDHSEKIEIPQALLEKPPHLSFQRSFYQEAFFAHAPPASVPA